MQGCANEGRGGAPPLQYCQICKQVGQKVSLAARELPTVFPVTFFRFSDNSWSNGQTPPPNGRFPTEGVSAHHGGCGSHILAGPASVLDLYVSAYV